MLHMQNFNKNEIENKFDKLSPSDWKLQSLIHMMYI